MNRRNRTVGTTVLGDAGTTEASVAPNLESLNTGSDAYVTTISDTSEFNVFGQTKIVDNFWETFMARHSINTAAYTQQSQQPDSTFYLQGNTEGWCRVDLMALAVPIEFKYNYSYTPYRTNEFFPDTLTSAANAWDKAYLQFADGRSFEWGFQAAFNNPAVIFSQTYLPLFRHAWFGCMDVFTRIRCLLGNNGQCIQSQFETEPIGLKYNMSTLRMGAVLEKAVGEWGLEQATGLTHMEGIKFSYQDIGDVAGRPQAFGADANATRQTWETNMRVANILHESKNGAMNPAFSRMISNVGSEGNFKSRGIALGPANNRGAVITRWIWTYKDRVLTLPLQAILPFFRGARYLPPDFRFKFEFNFNTQAVKIMEKNEDLVACRTLPKISADASYINRDPSTCHANVFVKAVPGDLELHYPWHVLRQPVQAAISSMWLQKPFLYNFETSQAVEVDLPSITTFINFSMSVSTERPTCIEVYLFPKSSDALWAQEYRSVEISVDNTNANFVDIGHRILNTPHLGGDYTSYGIAGVEKNDVRSGPVAWSECEVTFSGRSTYRFKNSALKYAKSHGVDAVQPYEYILQMYDEQSFRSMGTEMNARCQAERMSNTNQYTTNSYLSNKLLRLIVQPGGWADRAVISSRQGATSINIVIQFVRPVSNLDKIVAIRQNPYQLVFDSDKNVTLVQWPAIKSNQGYLTTNINSTA
jgi:hypothetical protein